MPASAKSTRLTPNHIATFVFKPTNSFRYSLRVSGNEVLISCANTVGLAWALSTLQQLLSHWPESKTCVVLIVDKPRLGHRGVLLDVARNFVPLPDITLLLRTMAAVKLNVLHMHLTDDQVSLTFPARPRPAPAASLTTAGVRVCECIMP